MSRFKAGVGATLTGLGAYLAVGDTQYTLATPFLLPGNIKTVLPNNGLLDPVNASFNFRKNTWDPLLRRFNPEYRNAVYSMRLSMTVIGLPGQAGRRWIQASFETPSVIAVSDTRILLPLGDVPPGGQTLVFSWLVPVPRQQIVDDGAQFFVRSDDLVRIFNIRMAFFRVGG